jgi:hypothetical protein
MLFSLHQSPGCAITAGLTLAMAIGASALSFRVINPPIVRPPNAPQAQSFYGIDREEQRKWRSPIPTISICWSATAALMICRLLASLR